LAGFVENAIHTLMGRDGPERFSGEFVYVADTVRCIKFSKVFFRFPNIYFFLNIYFSYIYFSIF
jgi:hypothetical protein